MLLVFNGGAMLISSLVSLIVDDGAVREITLSATIVIISGLFLMSFFKNNSRKINKRDGYLIVTIGWLTMVFSGMVPYYLTDSITYFPNYILQKCQVIPQQGQQF